jgi:endonuclease/exonuclease/phosphatase family metal-dependent hydrolase
LHLIRFSRLSVGAACLLALATLGATPGFAQTIYTANANGDIALPAGAATVHAGRWGVESSSTAANGLLIRHPNAGATKITTASAAPANYFEMTFQAEAGTAYRLWLHGRADSDYWGNDSVFVQFSGSVTATATPTYRIGTTSAAEVNLEECGGCGISGWIWQDTGYGLGVLGPTIYFGATGTQTVRVQTREDGLSIDQMVLSPFNYLAAAPSGVVPVATTSAPSPTPPPTTTTGVKLRVLQWNLHHGVGTDGKYDIDRIATWIVKMTPDVVMLNEVEKFTYWGNEDQPARYKALLESKTGRKWYSFFAQEFGNWTSPGKGNLILSTYPISATDCVAISYDRVVSDVTIQVNGRTINLLITHLDPDSSTRRLIQAQQAIAWAAIHQENRILTGDMNAWPDQTSIAELNKTYADSWTVASSKGTAYQFAGLSPNGATKKGRIDYIYASKNASNLVVLSSQVYDTRNSSGYMPSDHRPVLTLFEVR